MNFPFSTGKKNNAASKGNGGGAHTKQVAIPSTQDHVLLRDVREQIAILKTGDMAALIEVEGIDFARRTDEDRTGLIVALTHKLAGVHHDDVVADYLLTNDPERFEAFGAVWADGIRQERGVGPTLETMRMVMGVEPAYLERSLAEIEARSGSVEAYLRDVLGVDAGKRLAIEQRVFE